MCVFGVGCLASQRQEKAYSYTGGSTNHRNSDKGTSRTQTSTAATTLGAATNPTEAEGSIDECACGTETNTTATTPTAATTAATTLSAATTR